MNSLVTTAIVVLISFDGLRPDYINQKTTPNFYELQQQGVSAKYMEPSFPSSTFVNHASIMTGCTTEEHGIVANRFIDSKRGDFYLEDDSNWQECEPLWAATSRASIKTAVDVWPMSQTPWNGVKPEYVTPLPQYKEDKLKFFKKYDNKRAWNQLLEWLRLPEDKQPRLVIGYFPDIDSAGHKYGPFAPQTKTSVKKYDRQLGTFLQKLKKLKIYPQINLVLVSDHGMVEGTKPVFAKDNLEELKNRVEKNSWKHVYSSGTIINFYFQNTGQRNRAEAYLEKFPWHVYKPQEFPAHWHYHHPRSGNLVISLDPPYFLMFDKKKAKEVQRGFHGYDSTVSDVRAFFLATGPAFKKMQIEKIRNVDVAPTIAKILNISLKGQREGKPRTDILKEPN